MSSIDPPPDPFASLRLHAIQVAPSDLVRLAWPDQATHVGFRTLARYRFDSPDESFGVLYAAFSLTTAFAESVLRATPSAVDAGEHVMLDFAELSARRVITLTYGHAARALNLIKLYEEGLAAAKTDNRISSDDDYAMTRRWAKAFHDHPVRPDGIVYMSRYLGSERAVVLFNRCADAIAVDSVTPLLDHPELADILDRFELGVDRP
jgi:hypothetical protein